MIIDHDREHGELVVDGMAVSSLMGHVPTQRGVPARPTRGPGPSGHGPESHELGSFRGLQYVVGRTRSPLD